MLLLRAPISASQKCVSLAGDRTARALFLVRVSKHWSDKIDVVLLAKPLNEELGVFLEKRRDITVSSAGFEGLRQCVYS